MTDQEKREWAIYLCDCYTSQRFWSKDATRHQHVTFRALATKMKMPASALEFAGDAWSKLASVKGTKDAGYNGLDLYECAAELAQRIREGWTP